MSKNWIKGLKKSKEEAAPTPVPRTEQELSKEYTELCTKLGHAEYQARFQQSVVNAILSRIEGLDKELSFRKQLDAAEAKAKAAETGESK